MIPRTVLVIDGDTPTGTSICKKMREQGCIVAVICQNEDRALSWQRRMEREGQLFFVFWRDDPGMAACHDLLAEIVSYLGWIDVLIHAGHENIDALDLSCAFVESHDLRHSFGGSR